MDAPLIKKNEKGKYGSLAAEEKAKHKEGKVLIVDNLDVYNGKTLEAKIDSCIAEHPVFMVNQSNCLFSKDAKEFMTKQVGVDVFSIEVDLHPKGKQVRAHVNKKTKHKTTPIIFIKGDFLGGFEDVNHLYDSGELEKKYPAVIPPKAQTGPIKSTTQPLFWFPDKVNGNVVRITGVLTCLASACSAYYYKTWGPNIAYFLLIDFVLRLFGGAGLSVIGRLATILASPLEPQPRAGRPKQFATMCGIMFAFCGSLGFAVGNTTMAVLFMGGLACATGMEGFLDFCVGCVFFRIGVDLGLLPK